MAQFHLLVAVVHKHQLRLVGGQRFGIADVHQAGEQLQCVQEAGTGGGYRLAKGAHETVVAEIVLAVDEPIRATRCVAHGSPKGCMLAGERCITHNLWEDLGDEIHRYLAAVSLEDVVMN